MNILVIAGSPKGKDSITLHTCLYLEKKFPQHRFSYLQAGSRVKALEKDFSPALEALGEADMLLFCYPVYTFLVPYQLHRFIELMKASGEDFSGKWATQVSTSKHFYDTTAHRFIAHEAVEIYGNKGVVHGCSSISFEELCCNTVSCFACPSSHNNRDSNEYHQQEGVKQVGNDRKAADTGQTCRNK